MWWWYQHAVMRLSTLWSPPWDHGVMWWGSGRYRDLHPSMVQPPSRCMTAWRIALGIVRVAGKVTTGVPLPRPIIWIRPVQRSPSSVLGPTRGPSAIWAVSPGGASGLVASIRVAGNQAARIKGPSDDSLHWSDEQAEGIPTIAPSVSAKATFSTDGSWPSVMYALASTCSTSVLRMSQSTRSVAVSICRGEHESCLDGWLCREKKVGGICVGRLGMDPHGSGL